jgi:hypothetical protein
VNAAHWIADAAWIIRGHPDLDWSAVADEARRRRLGLQLSAASRGSRFCQRQSGSAPSGAEEHETHERAHDD